MTFAASEEEIALVHEEIAARNPTHREEYRRTATRARETARRLWKSWRHSPLTSTPWSIGYSPLRSWALA